MSFRRIGIWQTAFLGDAVLTLPLLQNLARAFPGAHMTYFVRKGLGPLFEPDPGLQVQEVDKYGRDSGPLGMIRTLASIRRQGFDLWVSPHTSFRSAAISAFSGIPTRIGYDSPRFNRAAYTHTCSRRFDQLEEIERVLQLLSPISVPALETWPGLHLHPLAREKAGEFRAKHTTGPVLGVHPGSTWATKKWPGAYFAEVIDMVHDNLDMQVMLFAGPGEEKAAREIKDLVRRQDLLLDLSGRLDLPGLAAFLQGLDCYLCNDSGPMHLAWTQNIPVAALFGPTTRSLGFFPRGEHSTVLETDLECRPCGLHGSKSCPQGHHRCMLDITPQRVFEVLKGKIHARQRT